jgi:hypothetical protein
MAENRFVQISVAVVGPNAGKLLQGLHLYALDSSGQLWKTVDEGPTIRPWTKVTENRQT